MRVIMRLCERIQVLDYGKTIAIGTPAEVRRDPAVLTAYLGSGERCACWRSMTSRSATAASPPLHGISLEVDEGEIGRARRAERRRQDDDAVGDLRARRRRAAARSPSRASRSSGSRPSGSCGTGIALVPEGRHIFATLTVAENLAARHDRAAATARAPRPTSRAAFERFPVLGSTYRQLGRQALGRRAAAARDRARAPRRPRLLLLDEPSLGLAPVVIDLVFDALEELRARGRDDPARRAERRRARSSSPTAPTSSAPAGSRSRARATSSSRLERPRDRLPRGLTTVTMTLVRSSTSSTRSRSGSLYALFALGIALIFGIMGLSTSRTAS